MTEKPNDTPKPPELFVLIDKYGCIVHSYRGGTMAKYGKQAYSHLDAAIERYVHEDELADFREKARLWEAHQAVLQCHLCDDDGKRLGVGDWMAVACNHTENDDER